ncbi:Oxidase ucsJ [Psilocybe cubensis]|uniref:NAD(P)-binding domain-containing protein n=2 Tax=Psilocybe cubensis TaxID=181762 RepID=A0A8H7Y0H2_PSICU|nr:Oxidase ucsJ [Psilocybe cubensis]KAH9481425.1 Oxidase ucsJ [Psilocybe cubensis]
MSSKLKILFTGATGYIGGSVLSRFLRHPDFGSFTITTLVRSPEKAEKLKALGFNAVTGSHDDVELMESLAADHDFVIATADADNYEAAIATLNGLKRRHEKTGTTPILIHTSGTGVLTDSAGGNFAGETVYDDANPDQIETLPDTQLHRNVDLEILRADKEGYLKSYIILPSTIWGIATGILVEKGIQNPHSIQVPALIRASLDRGRAGMVGAGKNLWPDVNIEEVADLYIVLFNAIRSNPSTTGHGREGIYFGESGEHSLYEVCKAIGQAMVALGKSDNPEPTTFTKEELDKYFQGSDYLGTNSRCRANRSRSIGWNPVKTKEDFIASIRAEVEALL